MKRTFIGLLIAIATIVLHQDAFACSCFIRSAHEYYIQAEFIAKVEIISMTKDEEYTQYHKAEIKIHELFKGETRDTISVYTGFGGGGDCGIWTEPGSEWLIVAWQYEDRLSFGLCSGSKKLFPSGSSTIEYEDREIRMLRTLKTMLGPPEFLQPNETDYKIRNHALDSLKVVSMPGETIALYLATFDLAGELKKLLTLREFENQSVALQLKSMLEKQLYLNPSSGEEEMDPVHRQRLIAIYYNPASKGKSAYFSKHY